MDIYTTVKLLVLTGLAGLVIGRILHNKFRRIDKERIIELRDKFAAIVKMEEGELKEYLVLMNSEVDSHCGNYLHKKFGVSKVIFKKSEAQMGYTVYIQLRTTMAPNEIIQLPGVYGVYELVSLASEYPLEKYKEVINE